MPGRAERGRAPERVVYHIDDADPERQRSVLRSVSNHLNAVGDEHLDLRIVVQGNGVSMLVADPAVAQAHAGDRTHMQIEDLKVRGVRFLVCGNSLRRRHIDPRRDLFDVTPDDVVTSGLAELVRLQGRGYTYIKP